MWCVYVCGVWGACLVCVSVCVGVVSFGVCGMLCVCVCCGCGVVWCVCVCGVYGCVCVCFVVCVFVWVCVMHVCGVCGWCAWCLCVFFIHLFTSMLHY